MVFCATVKGQIERANYLLAGDYVVAIYCLRCGTILPKDGARFCSTCGDPVPSDDLRTAPSIPEIAPPVAKKGHGKPGLREQIAQQPPARSGRHTIPDQPPA